MHRLRLEEARHVKMWKTLMLATVGLVLQPQEAPARNWLKPTMRVLVAPTSVSRAKNGDVRVVRRGFRGVLSVKRYRSDGSVKTLRRQRVKGSDGMAHRRTISTTKPTLLPVTGGSRVALERTKAAFAGPLVKTAGLATALALVPSSAMAAESSVASKVVTLFKEFPAEMLLFTGGAAGVLFQRPIQRWLYKGSGKLPPYMRAATREAEQWLRGDGARR
jgi:hypothetical protein